MGEEAEFAHRASLVMGAEKSLPRMGIEPRTHSPQASHFPHCCK